jgi:hypothetical protein
MNMVIDELRQLQKNLRGNFLLQLVEKILNVQKQNAINFVSIEESVNRGRPAFEVGLGAITSELMHVFKALMKQLQ